MTHQMATLALVLCMTISSVCKADALPSETDLKAGYCIGVWNAVLGPVSERQRDFEELPLETQEKFKRGIASREKIKIRINRYLMPRLPQLEMTGILLAMKAGRDDVNNAGGEVRDCETSCKPSGEHVCERACMDAITPLTVKIRSCNDVS